eukprot:TRINITY_DN1654_c0_g1_i1.p1 TRINITY_DN1654_c0_g1~~TRINITY_DN1654_c0_g1_i1.p1  ORF type:complete len:283 (-),score=17.74 TRINITY_DN1654_c0_g1_i1:28-852(-)
MADQQPNPDEQIRVHLAPPAALAEADLTREIVRLRVENERLSREVQDLSHETQELRNQKAALEQLQHSALREMKEECEELATSLTEAASLREQLRSVTRDLKEERKRNTYLEEQLARHTKHSRSRSKERLVYSDRRTPSPASRVPPRRQNSRTPPWNSPLGRRPPYRSASPCDCATCTRKDRHSASDHVHSARSARRTPSPQSFGRFRRGSGNAVETKRTRATTRSYSNGSDSSRDSRNSSGSRSSSRAGQGRAHTSSPRPPLVPPVHDRRSRW